MDSTLYDQFLPHRGLFHPGTVACGGSGPSSTSSSNSSRRPTSTTSRPPILDISSTVNCSPKLCRLVTTAADDSSITTGNGCHVDENDVTLGLALTSPDIEDFLFHTPPPSEISSDDASTALPLTPQPFATCDDDDNVLVGLLGGGVSMATTPESDILFTGAVTAEQEAYARGFVDALEELRRKDEGQGKPEKTLILNQQPHNQYFQTSGSGNFCFDAAFSASERTTFTGKAIDVRQSPLIGLSATGKIRWPAGYVEVSPQYPLNHQTPKGLASPASRTPTSNGQFAFLVDATRASGTDLSSQQPYRKAKFPRLPSLPSSTSTAEIIRSSNCDSQRKTLELRMQMSPPSVSGQQSMFVAQLAPTCRTNLSPGLVGGPYRSLQSLAGSSATAATDERAQTVPRLGTTPPLTSLSTGSGVSRRHVIDVDVLEEDVDDDEFGDGNMTPKELARADRKRERNRLAARKCRSRKLEQIATLEARCAVLRAENDALIKSASGIADDVAQLRDRLQRHMSGPDCRIGTNHKWPTLPIPETRQSDVVSHSASSSSAVST